MLTANIPFEAHLSLYEKQEMEMMDELLSMDFDENTDFEPMNNFEAAHRGIFYLRLFTQFIRFYHCFLSRFVSRPRSKFCGNYPYQNDE